MVISALIAEDSLMHAMPAAYKYRLHGHILSRNRPQSKQLDPLRNMVTYYKYVEVA
jgi:hypothetical protein